MTKATKRTLGVICLLWLGTLLLLFANYKTTGECHSGEKTAVPYHGGCLSENRCTTCDDFLLK